MLIGLPTINKEVWRRGKESGVRSWKENGEEKMAEGKEKKKKKLQEL